MGGSLVHAQDASRSGLSPLRNFDPQEYGYNSQNWDVTQSDAGLIYFANRNGVLEFDGASWNLYPLESGNTVRCVTSKDGTIYAGGKGEFGYLSQESGNALKFISLSTTIELDFADVWSCIATEYGVIFQSSNYLFLYDGERVDIYNIADVAAADSMENPRYYSPYTLGDRTFVSLGGGNGILEFDGEGFTFIEGSNLQSSVLGLLPHDDFEFIAVTTRKGLFTYDGDSFSPFETDDDNSFVGNNVYKATTLPNGNWVLASTGGGGVTILNQNGEIVQKLDSELGPNRTSLTGIHADPSGNLWIASEYGMSFSEVSSSFLEFDDRLDLNGLPNDALVFDGKLIVSTNLGVQALDLTSANREVNKFSNIAGLDHRSVELLHFDDQLITATYSEGVYRFMDGIVTWLGGVVYDINTLKRSTRNPNRIFLGCIGGVSSFLYDRGQWIDEGYLVEFSGDVGSILELPNGDILAGTFYKGVVLLRKQEGSDSVDDFHIEYLGEEHGLSTQGRVYLALIDSQVKILTIEGILQYENNRFALDPQFERVEKSLDNNFVSLTQGKNRLWGAGKNGLYALVLNENGLYQVDASFLSGRQVNNLSIGQDGNIWITENELITLFDSQAEILSPEAQTLIREIEDSRIDSTLFHASNNTSTQPLLEIPHENRSIIVRFANLGFDTKLSSLFRFRLLGLDSNWSTWTQETSTDYPDLPSGLYNFEVEGQNNRGGANTIASIPIRIKAPWYATIWAKILYAVLSVLILAGLLSVMRRRFVAMERARSFSRLTEAHDQLQRSHDSLRQTQRQLVHAEKLASMGQLTSGIAHEIKNPLNFINNFVELNDELLTEIKENLISFKDRKVGEVYPDLKATLDDIKENSTIIKKHGQRADRVVQSMMEHARGGEGEFSIVDFNQFVEEYVHLAYFSIKSKKQGINIDLVQDYDSACKKAPLMTQELGQVLINLLNNAYDAIATRLESESDPDFKPQLVISTRLETETNSHVLEVRDNGSGMSKKVMDHIFEPFYTTKKAGEGTGLGLSLSHEMVTVGHGGSIEVKSELNKGTTFSLILPLKSLESHYQTQMSTPEFNS